MPWKIGNNDIAVKRLKQLLQYILLRRTQGVIVLPSRTDLKFILKMSYEEQDYYKSVEKNVASNIDAVLNRSAYSTSSALPNVIQQINELRLICNLGKHRKVSNRASVINDNFWDSRTAQRALSTLATTDSLLCCTCGLDLDASRVGDGLELGVASFPSQIQFFRCLKIVCENCSSSASLLRCGCRHVCPRATVLYTPENTASGVSTPTGLISGIDEEPLPTKIKALVSDILDQPELTKRYVDFLI